MAAFISVIGKVITAEDLVLPKAADAITLINKLPFYSLVEIRRIANGTEIIIFDTEVEVGQRTVHDIRSKERIAVGFIPEDNVFPEVLALREDFPKVPHVNLRPAEKPRSGKKNILK